MKKLVQISGAMAIGLFCLSAAPLIAQTTTVTAPEAMAEPSTPLEMRAAQAIKVLKGEVDAAEVFAPSFLEAVPADQLTAIAAQMTAQYGAIEGIESLEAVGSSAARIVIKFEKATGNAEISISRNAPYLVDSLLVRSFDPIGDDLAAIRRDLSALPGDIGVLFAPIDPAIEPHLQINAENQMAIGSTFKLYILLTLAKEIEAGVRSWEDVVRIDRKSFPSGTMQDWPMGAPVTLHTLATMMISISDNTATDMLLHELGRTAVEAELIGSGHSDPDKTLPFLSTLEMFALKGSKGNLDRFIAATEDEQRAILADFENDTGGRRELVSPPTFTTPLAIDTVEWFASGRDLQRLGASLAALQDPTAREIMAVNTGLSPARDKDWAYIGFKGGSEPGVLNVTWLLRDKTGQWHILTISWNNTDANVDTATLALIAERLAKAQSGL